MKNTKLTLGFMLIMLLALSTSLMAQSYSGGSGTASDPYQIATKADLKYLSENSVEWLKHFIQTANITFTDADFQSGGDFYNSGKGFIPIGNSTTKFTGSYDGDGYTINNLYINRPASGFNGVGLFGFIDGATVSNLGVTNVNITGEKFVSGLVGVNFSSSTVSNSYSTGNVTGDFHVGGLVGYNNATVSNSYSTGSVTGSSDNVGGLVGTCFDATVSNSYSTGSVTGSDSYVGGLVGYCNNATVSNSYSTGSVTGINNVGGLVGHNISSSTISNSYSIGSVTGSGSSVGGLVGYSAGSISNSYSTGSVTGGSSVGGLLGANGYSGTVSDSFWNTETSGTGTGIGCGTTTGATGITTTQMQSLSTFTTAGWDFASTWAMSSSITFNQYPTLQWTDAYAEAPPSNSQIASLPNLVWIAQDNTLWNSTYTQTADINAWTTPSWDEGKGFSPIGNSSNQFTGNYDGDDHTIDNLYINRSNTSYVGLFGYTDGTTISNLGITNVNITANQYVGGLVGYIHITSTVSNSYSTGSVIGNQYVGGLMGYNHGSVSDSYSTGNVDGNYHVGGLVGRNYSSTLSNSYSTGSVSGSTEVGGLLGSNSSSLVTDSFWDTQTSGQSSSAGGTGKTTAEMKTKSTFTNAGWDFNDIWAILTTYNNGYPNLDHVADVITWTGSSSAVWGTEGNWDLNAVPTGSNDVIIANAGQAPVIGSGLSGDCKNLTINSGASLTVNSGGSLITNGTITNNGTINVKRLISNNQWHLISSPNNVATVNIFAGDYLQTWDETNTTWWYITAPATPLTKVKGYSLWGIAKTNTTYTFTGTPNTGAQSLAITVSGSGSSNGCNLLGNPYPSSIDWALLDGAENGAVYYWYNSLYRSWNNGSGTGSQYIAPMQGFFIIAGSTGTFNVDNSDRVHNGANNYYKSANKVNNGLVLMASNGTYEDELWIAFDEETSPQFDYANDAYKFLSNTSGIAQIYSITDDQNLSIDIRPETNEIQLGFQNDQNGVYQIGISQIDGLTSAVLEDTKTNTFHDLNIGNYEFAWNITDNEKRFKLHLNTLGISEDITNNEEILIYSSEKTIYVKNKGIHKKALMKITDITGRVVMEKNIQLNELISIPTNLNTGVYVVSLINNNYIKTKKIIIK